MYVGLHCVVVFIRDWNMSLNSFKQML